MTDSQYRTMMTRLRDLSTAVDKIENRLAYLWPSEAEAREQIHRELDSILAPGSGVQVFAE